MRIPPFFIFADGERQRSVLHGVQHVDERHLTEDHTKKFRAHVNDTAHQQAAGAAALNGQFFGRSVPLRNQVFGGTDEIGKGILLLLHPPGVVPRLSEFAATADVCDGVNDTAIQEAQTIRIEVHGHRNAVAAIAVKEQRGGAMAGSVPPIHERNRNPRAIQGGRVQALAHILRSIVAAKHGLLLA